MYDPKTQHVRPTHAPVAPATIPFLFPQLWHNVKISPPATMAGPPWTSPTMASRASWAPSPSTYEEALQSDPARAACLAPLAGPSLAPVRGTGG
jgi:hypothetical protein